MATNVAQVYGLTIAFQMLHEEMHEPEDQNRRAPSYMKKKTVAVLSGNNFP